MSAGAFPCLLHAAKRPGLVFIRIKGTVAAAAAEFKSNQTESSSAAL